MARLFVSHSTQDDDFVRELRWTLADLGEEVWIDSRELRGGDPLWPEIQKAIDEAAAFAVVISSHSHESEWVSDELEYAVEVQQKRGKNEFPVIPLLMNGSRVGSFKKHFGEMRLHIDVSSAPGGIEAAIDPLLVALGKRKMVDVAKSPAPRDEPIEELVLELSDLKFHEENGVRRPSALAKLLYHPAATGKREVESQNEWRFVAPIGPIESDDLRWYLESYAIWPSDYFRDRARKVEENLVQWGKLLHAAAFPAEHTGNVMTAWGNISSHASRRFSIYVKSKRIAGAPDADVKLVSEAAIELLRLPWELLHDGDRYLFQGARPTRVRRRLPNTKNLDVSVVEPPIRVLLVTARPEDKSCGYIDHRASALPLVEAMERLGGLVRLHVLNPPTLDALDQELKRASDAQAPYHVVHFDGHGVFDRWVGLGGLCFESPNDLEKLEGRSHELVHTDKLGPLLMDSRIPLVFLEACQTAQSEEASESVASDLLRQGVVSVVAMSHSVLVETSRRFVERFYASLAEGKRVGDAMLDGQRYLHTDDFRGHAFGVGEFRLQDWFVPVLFQEKDDPRLFRRTTAPPRSEDLRAMLATRLGQLPSPPETSFVGRSRELLALQRLLFSPPLPAKDSSGPVEPRYAVIRGQGGEGKTALAAEFARWMVRSQQARRAAFVSVEVDGNAAAVLNAIGGQIVGKSYPLATSDDLEKSIQHVERALRDRATLIVVDNMESVLPPEFLETPEALAEEAQENLRAILALCGRLQHVGGTRVVFTSREQLPEPFAQPKNQIELRQLHPADAVKLVERVLNQAGAGTSNTEQEAIEDLVKAVHCHARSLTLLAPYLRERGVAETRDSLAELMADMDRKISHLPANDPRRRENSLFASLELSLRRMSPANQERARVLGVFHGGFLSLNLALMMSWEMAEVEALGNELIATGLASGNSKAYLSLNPAFCPYLRRGLSEDERQDMSARWAGAMAGLVSYLVEQQHQNTQLAVTLTMLDLPNLLALLDHVQAAGDAEATIALATLLYGLLQRLGKPGLVRRVGQVRDDEAGRLEKVGRAWNGFRFQAQNSLIEQQLAGGQFAEALSGSEDLLNRARTAGEQAYPDADYDLAMAYRLRANVLKKVGQAEAALTLLDDALKRFEAAEKKGPSRGAERMASVCIKEQGDCFLFLGLLDKAAKAYIEAIRRAKQRNDERSVAVGEGSLGTVWLRQRRFKDALDTYENARNRFEQLNEQGSVAGVWHQTGMALEGMGELEKAEAAYRESLKMSVQLYNLAAQAMTLVKLGNLFGYKHHRLEEAVGFFRQAADITEKLQDVANESHSRSNLGEMLRRLGRFDEARVEILRAIACSEQSGFASEPWASWGILADIESEAGKPDESANAKKNAIANYLAYRRAGGENHDAVGRIAIFVTKALLDGETEQIVTELHQLANDPNAPGAICTFLHTLHSIASGSRDRNLSNAPDLDYTMAAEILFLIETLEGPGPAGGAGADH